MSECILAFYMLTVSALSVTGVAIAIIGAVKTDIFLREFRKDHFDE